LYCLFFSGFAEIGGGYLIWLWLREGKAFYWGAFGGLALELYGIIATFQTFPSFGRVYAAYGGVFIVLSVLWGWGIDKRTPDLYDWIGVSLKEGLTMSTILQNPVSLLLFFIF